MHKDWTLAKVMKLTKSKNWLDNYTITKRIMEQNRSLSLDIKLARIKNALSVSKTSTNPMIEYGKLKC